VPAPAVSARRPPPPARRGDGGARPPRARADDRPGPAPGRRARPARDRRRRASGRPRRPRDGRAGQPARGHAGRPGYVRRARPRAGALTRGRRADPAKPHLPAARGGGRGLARVHGDGAAVRGVVERALRPDRARHAAVAARARLPRGAGPGDPVRGRPGAAAAGAAGGAGRAAGPARPRRRPEPRAGSDRAADGRDAPGGHVGVPVELRRDVRRLPAPRRRGGPAAWPRPRPRSCS